MPTSVSRTCVSSMLMRNFTLLKGDHDIGYEAHLDEVPDSAVEADPAALPSWLRSQTI